MALIDVSQLMVDPDFVDSISVVSRVTAVNDRGENEVTETTVQTVGSVQPAPAKTIQRLPDALRVADLSSFWVKGTITIDGSGKYPAILIFKGRRYQVQTVADYSNFGEGYCEGTCVVEKPAAP